VSERAFWKTRIRATTNPFAPSSLGAATRKRLAEEAGQNPVQFTPRFAPLQLFLHLVELEKCRRDALLHGRAGVLLHHVLQGLGLDQVLQQQQSQWQLRHLQPAMGAVGESPLAPAEALFGIGPERILRVGRCVPAGEASDDERVR